MLTGAPRHLESVRTAVAAVAAARSDYAAALDSRDETIRDALAAGVPYADLMVATGMSRSALDTIRKGRRSRSA